MLDMMKHFAEKCAASFRARAAATIVLGNEAGDMDSVVGSYYLAYLLQCLADRHDTSYNYKGPICPMINFPRCDLTLRNDVLQTLAREGNITPDLVFSCTPGDEDEGYLPLFSPANATESPSEHVLHSAGIILFDHNKLAPWQSAALSSRVIGVVDHHADEQLYESSEQGYVRIVCPAGSACTHLVHLYLKHNVPIPQPRLLFAPILLDTMNFDPALKKTTPLDETARDQLLQAITAEEGESQGGALPLDVKKMFDHLVALKFDVSGLTIPQTLRRDYKRFEMELRDGQSSVLGIGISSVLLLRSHVSKIYSDEAWIREVNKFRQKENCDVFLVMFCAEEKESQVDATESAAKGKMVRQLGVLASDEFIETLNNFAAVHVSIGLRQLAGDKNSCPARATDSLRYVNYDQDDYATSRKALTPLLGDFLRMKVRGKM